MTRIPVNPELLTWARERDKLDGIIPVGYRVNSGRATRFRQWATGILRGHLA